MKKCNENYVSTQTFPHLLPPIRLQLKRLIKNNAIYEKRSTYRRCCWYVHTEVLSRFSQDGLPLPCQWTYLTTGAKEEEQAATGSQGNSPTTPQNSSTSSSTSNKRKSTGSMSITKFMKRCTDTEQVRKHSSVNGHCEISS